MSTIKPIEGRSVHQIQSGQVIVDLCSVVKELVENSLDAGATSIDVRFKSHGLESIEVQDNGAGILPQDYETIALKHYTSKLSSYEDLSSLDTFGFRGEALSSLCALSHFHILTARDTEAPKGKKLDFEPSGKLEGTIIIACQKGTTVAVETLFYNLPVRRRELEKNIKREYGKVLGILHAYACISTNVRFSVSNQINKGKKVVMFSTSSNPSTKQNISNVFGAKTLLALIPMNLELELEPTVQHVQEDPVSRKVVLEGHVSRPIFGEGRQTPDRQMFFVNSRPCALPQVAKAFNEVYKSYNITQSPFVFANLKMNTNAYDVNVSPDKRTILLHDQAALLETLKKSLNDLFEAQDQTVPQSLLPANHLPPFRPLTVNNDEPPSSATKEIQPSSSRAVSSSSIISSEDGQPAELVEKFAMRNIRDRGQFQAQTKPDETGKNAPLRFSEIRDLTSTEFASSGDDLQANTSIDATEFARPRLVDECDVEVTSQNLELGASQINDEGGELNEEPLEIPTIKVSSSNQADGVVQSAFDMMRPRRTTSESATVNIGPNRSTAMLGTPAGKRRKLDYSYSADRTPFSGSRFSRFAKRIHVYAAPGSQGDRGTQESDEESEGEADAASEDRSPSPSSGRGGDSDAAEVNHNDSVELVQAGSEDESDAEYVDETERKRREDARVEDLVRRAEAAAAHPTQGQKNRAASLLKSTSRKDSTLSLVTVLDTSVQDISRRLVRMKKAVHDATRKTRQPARDDNPDPSKVSAEERLALTIAKTDFANMRIIGQFNLGFILATRPGRDSCSADLFIIDQHASDEIYNFSRLSLTTTLNPQPLVRPHPLELTAIEEETILQHTDTLVRNGFTISVDESGDCPVGQRCQLLTLPTSRETVFDTRDLEELIALLGDASSSARGDVIRPSKVRKMLAMRACRSSIMVGKSLTKAGMGNVVRHMGEIDRPWNCPHGRPTMRHLAGLGDWSGWREGDGLVDDDVGNGGEETDWRAYLERAREEGLSDGCEGLAQGEEDLSQVHDGIGSLSDETAEGNDDENDDNDETDDNEDAESLGDDDV